MRKWFELIKKKKTAMTIAAILVVFVTTYTLILPALTVEQRTASEAGIMLNQDETNGTDAEAVTVEQDTAEVSQDTSGTDAAVKEEAASEETAEAPLEAEESEDTSASAEDTADDADAIAMPEQKFEKELKEEKITIYVEAEEGALPESTEMKVEMIDDQDTLDKISEKAEEEAKKEDKTIGKIQAVDISFWHEDKEIEPEKEVYVTIASDMITEDSDQMIVHVNDEDSDKVDDTDKGKAEVVKPMTEKQLKEKKISPAADEVVFKAEQFSPYAIVETETLTTEYITAEGETYKISVTYEPEAEIPEGAELRVQEIVDSEAYNEYLRQAKDALKEDNAEVEVSFARFFDIEIRAKGKKIEPKVPVEVKIINTSAPYLEADETMNIVHFADRGTEVISDVSVSDDGKEIIYNQNGFSVTGEVAGRFSGNNWPDTEAGDYVLVVYSGTGDPYYAVNSSGGLVEVDYNAETSRVTFPDNVAPTTADLTDYWWTYYVNGGNHRLMSVANQNNKIYPQQTDNGSALTNSTNSPGANQGYIYRGNQWDRYCVAINDAGTSLISSHVSYSWYSGYTYPSNAAHFLFVNNFEEDVTGAYGTAESTVLTGNRKTLRMAEVATSDEGLIDFEGFTWRSANTSVATVTTDPDTDAPIATAVATGTTRIIGTRTNEHGELDEVVWTVTVKDKTNNSIVFLHQPQNNANFAGQDTYRPHDGYGNTEPTNYVKFVVALADANGNIRLYNGKPNVELPTGSIVPDRYEFELDSSGIFAIEEDTLSGISVPGYSYAGTYAYFGWYNNTDLDNMAVVSEFKNLGAISSRYPNYYSVLGFKTSRGNPQYQDYSQREFGNRGYGYYAYNPTGVLMIVLQPVNEDITYRTSYHNDYVPGGTARTNIVDTTRAQMIQGEWIPDEYRHDWYGETIMTTKTGSDLTPPADGYEFVGWFDSVDEEGNGAGNQIIGRMEDGNFYAIKNGEKIIIRQNNDIYAKWQLVRGTISIRKEIIGDLSDDELNDLKEKLTFKVTDDTTGVVIEKKGSDLSWNLKNGMVDISGLSAATTYTVTESNADVANYDVTTEITGGTNIKISKTGAKVVSVKNTYFKKAATIKVIKMESGTNKKLSDAKFNLYRPAKEGDAEIKTIKVNGSDVSVTLVKEISVGANGEVEVANMPVGPYYLVETNPPEGHELLTGVICFELTSEGINLRTQDHVKANGFELTVYNDSGVTLPNTGGSGTLPYTLGGSALLAFATFMYGFRMRRRERRLH